jgi:hypothetical protein
MNMKISPTTYAELRDAVLPIMQASAISRGGSNMRHRWDCFWASEFPLDRLYDEGLNDDHIDTALRAIVREGER